MYVLAAVDGREKTRPADQIMLGCESCHDDGQTSNHAMLVLYVISVPLPPSPMLSSDFHSSVLLTTLDLRARGWTSC